MRNIYLDHAAATPMSPLVLSAMQSYFSERFYNPSAVYMAAQSVKGDLQAARATVARCLGVRPVEVVFTAGGTEANNLAIRGVMDAFPDGRVLISSVEHDSVLEAARQYDHGIVPVNAMGVVDLAALESAIDDRTVLVSVMYANNEVGAIQPVRDIASIVNTVRAKRKQLGIATPLYLHTDAAQASNYLDLHAARLGVDLMTVNGGKIYGPKQSGALFIRSGLRLRPLVYGGGQEQGLRSGTENVAAAIGFAEALSATQQQRNTEVRRLQELQQYFIAELQRHIPGCIINGTLKKRLPNNVHVTIPGQDNERLLFALDERGIQAAAGSACSASDDDASHVLLAMGLTEAQARASLRFTMGRPTVKEDIDTTVTALAAILA